MKSPSHGGEIQIVAIADNRQSVSRCEIDSHQIIVVTQVVVRADGEKKVLKKDQVQQASGLSIRSTKEGLKVFNKGEVQQVD